MSVWKPGSPISLHQPFRCFQKFTGPKAGCGSSIDLLTEGRAYIESYDPRRVTIGGLAFVGQAIVLREWNDLDEAEKLIRRSLELCEPWANPSATCAAIWCWPVNCRIKVNLLRPQETLHLAEESIRSRSPFPEVICDLNAVRVGFWLATGQLSKASQWAREWQKSVHPEDRVFHSDGTRRDHPGPGSDCRREPRCLLSKC